MPHSPRLSAPLPRRWHIALWSVFAALLLIPAIAMQFTAQVMWTPRDFLFAALLLGSVGLAVELVVARVTSPRRRAALLLTIAGAGFLVWLDGAVGIF